MIPSSSSGLSGQSNRPTSRASQRPPSSASHRPPSSASYRPPSSASARAYSRLSQHPGSARHTRSRLLPLCQTLVAQLTGLTETSSEENGTGDAYAKTVDYAVKNLESTTMTKGGVGVHLDTVERQIRGHAQKARINSRDAIAEALETSLGLIKAQVAKHDDLDAEIKMSRLADHLSLLLQLSNPSTPVTVARAETYLHQLAHPVSSSPPPLTWAEILKDAPFEGQHWEGVYGMPPGSVITSKDNNRKQADDWDSSDEEFDRGSAPSLSPWESDDGHSGDLPDSQSVSSSQDETAVTNKTPPTKPPQTYVHRRAFEDLKKRQYWREDYRSDTAIPKSFDLGDVTSLGPTLRRVMGDQTGHGLTMDPPEHEKYIDEYDAVREVIMALQGRRNILLSIEDDKFVPLRTAPRLMYLSLTSQHSILSSFARVATDVARLRRFVFDVLMQPPTSKTTRTLESFADALDAEIHSFDAWCASREEDMCRASAGIVDSSTTKGHLVVSLLSTKKVLNDTFEESFSVLLRIWLDLKSNYIRQRPPANITARLLNVLFEEVQEYSERGERVTADALMRVFIKTAEPIWGMVGTWLKNGMGMSTDNSQTTDELDEEFFIEASGLGMLMHGAGGGLLDPEFWAEGYTLRDVAQPNENEELTKNEGRIMVPTFLEHVAEGVLASGKAIGLLRALNISPPDDANGGLWLCQWRTFGSVLASTGSISVDTLSQVVYDELSPHCDASESFLAAVILDECDLLHHVSAIENLFFMRRGDAMSHFIDIIFARMDNQHSQSWSDFHFMNTAFRDVVDASTKAAGGNQWINTSLVRLSYRSSTREKEKTINRTVKAIDGLLLEYAVPFPLTYVFTPKVFVIYVQVFTFLLQIRRAKNVLERILVRGPRGVVGTELKTLYAMRSRLSWFVNVLLNFLTTYVIHTQVLKFHSSTRDAKSMDEIIKLHDAHLERIQARCLLQPNTSALYRAILSILDICLNFADHFVALAGDTTHDISRLSMSMSRHRSRRQRRQRRNLVSFSHSIRGLYHDESSDDSDDSAFDNERNFEPSVSVALSSTSSAEEGRIEKMSVEFDGLVKFVRRGVESFAGGVGDAAPAFGVLAFALEDWDT